MGRSSRQSFKKRQRELSKKQKRQDKVARLAARRAGDTGDEEAAPAPEDPDGKPRLKIIVTGGPSG
ncbi:MAG: hypothetical protein JXR96_01340 [Deltaproteobacteria bacterium]|nr:hypothetical protein [Deltaproteobacteria bacterium]